MKFHILWKEGESVTLRERRVAAGMKQEDVAQTLEVDQTTISRWESGGKPLKKYQKRLAELYGCEIEELMGEGE